MTKQVKMGLLAILVVFLIHAVSLNFIQDDAFISYRYVRNFLAGHGLVFNPGERVEGYTNFLWVILLAILARFGLNVILASKILGLASGCVALVLLYQISVSFLCAESSQKKPIAAETDSQLARLLSLVAPLLLALNGAFAYWSISGLETVFFVMAVLLSVYLYLTRERLMIISCALSSLIRPEGVFVFAVLIIHKFVFRRDGLRACLLYILGFTLFLLPYLVFKLIYYGDLLPNPFYAKTGLSWEYLKSGLSYLWLFLKHYGLWGLLYVIPLAFYRKIQTEEKLLYSLIFLYTLSIIVIGGDVLQGHRFFLPVAPFLYLIWGIALMRLALSLKRRFLGRALATVLVIALALATFFLPRDWLLEVRRAEVGLCLKMSERAAQLRRAFGTNFTLATTTIGAISYYSEARVIDMMGLTDPYIAKHPENIPGIVSPWKEKRFNSQYLLSQDPDVILFSTGIKPSAPAERALFLNSKFRENYYPYYFPGGEILVVVYKRKGDYPHKNQLFPDARFVNLYNQALNLGKTGQAKAAAEKVEEVLQTGPEDFAWAHDYMASLQLSMKDREAAKKYAREAIKLDEYCMLSHLLLKEIYLFDGDSAAAQQEHDKILQLNPELLRFGQRSAGGN